MQVILSKLRRVWFPLFAAVTIGVPNLDKGRALQY